MIKMNRPTTTKLYAVRGSPTDSDSNSKKRVGHPPTQREGAAGAAEGTDLLFFDAVVKRKTNERYS